MTTTTARQYRESTLSPSYVCCDYPGCAGRFKPESACPLCYPQLLRGGTAARRRLNGA